MLNDEDDFLNTIAEKYLVRLLMVISVSGFIFYNFISYLQYKVIPFQPTQQEIINQAESIHYKLPSNFEMIVVMISVICLLFLPMAINKNKTYIKFFSILITVYIIYDLIAYLEMRISGHISLFFMSASYISILIFVWIMIDFFKIVYIWIRGKDNTVDVARLTFIWAIVTFILNLLWLGSK